MLQSALCLIQMLRFPFSLIWICTFCTPPYIKAVTFCILSHTNVTFSTVIHICQWPSAKEENSNCVHLVQNNLKKMLMTFTIFTAKKYCVHATIVANFLPLTDYKHSLATFVHVNVNFCDRRECRAYASVSFYSDILF